MKKKCKRFSFDADKFIKFCNPIFTNSDDIDKLKELIKEIVENKLTKQSKLTLLARIHNE